MIGAVLSTFTTPFAVFADPVEPGTVEAELDTSALCNPEDIAVYAPQPSSTSERPCPTQTSEADETARARAYLIATATPGYTMTRQGPERAIEGILRWSSGSPPLRTSEPLTNGGPRRPTAPFSTAALRKARDSGQLRPAVVAIIRGITIGLSSVRLAAEDFVRRGSPSKFAMRGTPFGQPSVST
jgi:hypothetical protein